MAKEAYFKLSKGKIEVMKFSSEFAELVRFIDRKMVAPADIAIKHEINDHDLIFSIFKEGTAEVISIGSVRYGVKITLKEFEQLYNFIKSEEMREQVIAQLV